MDFSSRGKSNLYATSPIFLLSDKVRFDVYEFSGTIVYMVIVQIYPVTYIKMHIYAMFVDLSPHMLLSFQEFCV